MVELLISPGSAQLYNSPGPLSSLFVFYQPTHSIKLPASSQNFPHLPVIIHILGKFSDSLA